MATVTETVILTSGTSWKVPYTWNSSNNSVTCIGGGAGGGSNATSRGGGGGGGRSISTNLSLTAGANVSIAIGAGGSAGVAGGDTTFNSSAIVAKGGSTTTTSTGGAGGSSASGTGATKYSGGSGGNGGNTTTSGCGGGGGCAGDTANGSNGGNNSTGTGGAGGAGGATGGATSTAGGAGNAGSGKIGYDNGSSATGLGTNYAGSGGPGAGGDGYGVYIGGPGALFGAGGGGGNVAGGGAQGGIIISWTWQSVLPSSGQISMSEVAVAVKKTTSGINLNDSDVRTAFGMASGQIALGDGYSDYLKTTVVTYINSTGTGTNPVSLLSGGSNYGGWVEGDLALAFVQNGANAYPTQDNGPGWKYLGRIYSSTGYYLHAYSRILQQGDANFYHTQTNGGCHILILRGPSVATVVGTFNSTGANGSFTGITKSSNSKTLASFVSDRDSGATGITVPTSWTQSGAAQFTYFYAKSGIIDAASYTNNTTITWTGFGTTYYQTGILLELT